MDLKTVYLEEFLKYKTLYYDKIDYSTIKKSWLILSQHMKLPYVIHIVGTNGKGSTGRFLAHYLHKTNHKTLHYSSPHIIKFNERIWVNGFDIDNETLELSHKYLQKIYSIELLKKLTYFEYTTLLAIYISRNVDYLVLEAGLGGEFDATNVVKNDLSLITTIDLDHQSFLGNTVEEIALTKMRSVDKKMILGFQVNNEVLNCAKKIGFERNIEIKYITNFEKFNINKKYASYLKRNLHLVIDALDELGIEIDLKLFDDVNLFGRCQKISKNITIDVGHNPLAAKVIAEEFKDKKVTLVYNSFEDKEYDKVLEILKPIIKEIIILDIDDKRIVNKVNLSKIIDNLNIIQTDNLQLKSDKEYLVFGSFLVVENFLSLIGFNEK